MKLQKKLILVIFLVIVIVGSCSLESFSQPITGNTNVTVGSFLRKGQWQAFKLSSGALNVNCIINAINSSYTMKIAFKKAGVRDTTNYYPYTTGNKPCWINRQSDSMFVWCLDSLSSMTFSVEQLASTYPAPSLQMNDAIDNGSSDTNTYLKVYNTDLAEIYDQNNVLVFSADGDRTEIANYNGHLVLDPDAAVLQSDGFVSIISGTDSTSDILLYGNTIVNQNLTVTGKLTVDTLVNKVTFDTITGKGSSPNILVFAPSLLELHQYTSGFVVLQNPSGEFLLRSGTTVAGNLWFNPLYHNLSFGNYTANTRDSAAFNLILDTNQNRHDVGLFSNASSTKGIYADLRQGQDYITFSGVSGTATYNFIGDLKENGTALTSKYSQLTQLDTLPQLSKSTNTFTGNLKVSKLAVNQSGVSPIPYVGVAISVGDTNLYGLNVVGTNNTVRSSQSQAIDTSSISFGLTQWTKKPLININSATGTNIMKLDSLGLFTFGAGLTVAGDITTSNASFFRWSSRGTLGASADGTYNLYNNAGTGFTSFTVGAGSLIAGFVKGTTLTTTTGWFSKSADGTTWYCYINNSGTIITQNTLF